MLDISNAVHAWSFSELTGLLETETLTNSTVVPTTGQAFVRSHYVIFGGLGFNIIYVWTWPLGISWGREMQDTLDNCLSLKRRTTLTQRCIKYSGRFRLCFVVADWHIRDSGGLVINRNPQFFKTFIVKAASVTFHGCVWRYIISGELVYIA